jgi:hypothetical protein
VAKQAKTPKPPKASAQEQSNPELIVPEQAESDDQWDYFR